MDGNNKPWKQNTNYSNKEDQTINQNSLEKWQTILDHSDIRMIELIAKDWMDIYGYNTSLSLSELEKSSDLCFRKWPTKNLSEWIKPYSFDENNSIFASEILIEKLRLHYVYSGQGFTDEDEFSIQSSRFVSFME